RRQRKAAAVRFSSLQTLSRLKPSKSLLLRRLVLGLRVLTLGLLILAMARPQTGRKQTQVRTEGIDIVLVLDTSGSMQALDLDGDKAIAKRRNRLEVAKSVVEEFIKKRDNDQIGLVVFGDQAFTQCPLTLDHGIVATFLERIEIGVAGDGTAIGSALGTAVKRLKDSEAKSKVIILLTDGRNNAGSLSPGKAAEIAKTFGIKVYTIGAGTRGKAPFLVDSFFGQQVVYEAVQIDEGTLEAIAKETGGAYFRAQDESALASIYDEIDQLEKTEITMHTYMEYNERFRWFVLPALGLLLLEVGLLGTRFRKLP
ncbi:MAG: VWA domain-containing protein, partial [Acidobacteria bacterium]|nr:VWA domain-containing protein [Acidobacteriota bacterium]